MDNNEERNSKSVGGNKAIIIILVLIIIGLITYIAYDNLVIDQGIKTKTVETEDNNTETEKETKKEDNKEKNESSEESQLFNEEMLIENVCPDYKCEKELGDFVLGENKYNVSLSIAHEKESFIIFDNGKKIGTNNQHNDTFDKIVKIGSDYLAVGIKSGPNIGYDIKIYDNNLNRIKDFSSLKAVPLTDNFKDYFTVSDNTFTHYSCDTSKDTGDGSNQYLVKHLVTIENGNFEEKEVSRVKQYCSAQS